MPYAVKEIVYTLQGEGAQAGRAAVFCRFAGCNLWTGHEVDRAAATCAFCDTDFVGTDGPGGGRFETAAELARAIRAAWAPLSSIDVGTAERGATASDQRESAVRASLVRQLPISTADSLHSLAVAPVASHSTDSHAARTHSPALSPLVDEVHPLVVFTGGEPALQLDAPLLEAVHAEGFEIAIETNGTIELPAGIDWICVSPKAGAALRVAAGDELKLIHPQPGAEPERYARLPFRHFFLQPMDGPDRERNTREVVAYCLAHPQWRVSVQMHKLLGIP